MTIFIGFGKPRRYVCKSKQKSPKQNPIASHKSVYQTTFQAQQGYFSFQPAKMIGYAIIYAALGTDSAFSVSIGSGGGA